MNEHQKNILFYGIVIIAIALSVGVTFYKTVIKQDFEVIDTSSEEGVELEDVQGEEGADLESVDDSQDLSTTTATTSEDLE
jgi:hypothetical protein